LYKLLISDVSDRFLPSCDVEGGLISNLVVQIPKRTIVTRIAHIEFCDGPLGEGSRNRAHDIVVSKKRRDGSMEETIKLPYVE